MVFNKVGIRFFDIDAAAQFFIRNLSFCPHSLLQSKTGKKIVCIEKNGVILEIFEARKKIAGDGFFKLLSFEVQDILETINKLREKNVEILEEATKAADLDGNLYYYAYFRGPEDMKLVLYQKICNKESAP